MERKIGYLLSRLWGGRKARTRGKTRVATDADTRTGALNWTRLDILGLRWTGATWVATGPCRKSDFNRR